MITNQGNQVGGRSLSAAQRRLWLAYKLAPRSAEFTAPWAGRLRGDLDLDALRRAWWVVLERHAELRLRLSEARQHGGGEPTRSHWPVDDFPLTVREIAADTLDAELDGAVTRVFDLVGGRLADAELLRLGPGDHVLVVGAHHAVVDGRSMAVIVRDLFAAYAGRDLAEPTLPYGNYVDAEAREVPARPAGDKLDSWIEDLRVQETLEPLGLEPVARSADKDGDVVSLPLPATTWEALRELARRHRTTPQVLGLSAFALTIGRYTDTDDLVIGGTMDTRSGDFADTVGMFVNPTPVRVRIDQTQPVSAFCQSVHRGLLRAYTHRNVPFEEVVRRLQVVPDVTRTPVFQVLFNFEARETDLSVPGLAVATLELPVRFSKYDLTMVLRDNGATGELRATYRASRYTRAQIEQFTGHVATVLTGLPAADTTDDTAVGSLPMVSADECEQLLAAGRGPAVPHDFRAVHDMVADLATAEPTRPAVTCGSTTLTYGELHAWAGALAGELAASGARPGTPVAVLGEPSVEMVVAVLAVLRAGGSYVPLNHTHPVARLTAVLADAGAEIVLGDADWQAQLPDVQVISPNDVPRDGAAPEPHAVRPDDAAYVIYTSGTTGEPKGVVVEHGALAASTAARRQVYGTYRTFLLVSPLSFDSSVAGLWGTLTTGGRLVVAQTDDVRDPERAVGLIETHGVTALLSVPALYAGLLDCAERTDSGRLRALEVVVTAGEALPEPLVARHFAQNGSAAIVNEYGPTEATVWSTYRRFDRPGPVDIGGPVPGATLYVLDRQGRLMPPGAAGELHVGGLGVARGYLGRPELTENAFGADEFAGPGARRYRTGDWVRWRDGGLKFLGRRDNLVKVRGHRVELGAVETVLRQCAGVADAAVLLAGDGASLTAFLVAGTGYDESAVRGHLAGLLPPPMVPGVLRVVDELPRVAHGKVDHDALRALDVRPAAESVPVDAAPSGGLDLRDAVRAAWCEVLEVDTVPFDVNFFDAGGHSLLVPSLQMELEDRIQITLPIVDLFNATTVEAQVALLAANVPAAPAEESLVPDLRGARLAGRSRRAAVEERS